MSEETNFEWIQRARANGWAAPLRLTLDALEPFGPLGAQLLWVLQPTLGGLFAPDALREVGVLQTWKEGIRVYPEIEALRKEVEALRLELASVQVPRESSMQPSQSVSQEGVSSVQAIQEAAGDAGRDPGLIDSEAAPVNPEMAGDDTQAAVSARPSTSEPMPSVQEYVRQASVTGIRLSGPSPKVVLNNRVYRLNENVLDSQGIPIRIVGIERTTITFEDEYGFRYTKRF